jgi:UDPglucose 6-dehydrogenase
MRVSIVGTGYVGLVSGACLADAGHDVVCIDIDPRKVEMINSGEAPIHEAGLPELMKRHVGSALSATLDLPAAVRESDLTFIAVGTPAVGGRIDLQFVEAAAREIGAAIRDKGAYHTVVVKSTVVPGTTVGTVRRNIENASGLTAGTDFGLGMNPEFLTEGTAVADFSHPDRLVLGGIDQRTQDTLAELYAGFDASVPRIRCNPTTAEMIKYASNAVLATMISFSNEIARMAAAVADVDALDVMKGVHEAAYFTSRVDGTRVTAGITSFLEAGAGFGGSCLPKDVTALIGEAASLGVSLPLLESVLEINRGQPDEVMRLIAKHVPSLRGVRVAVLGLAFKPETDDVRESPAFPIIARLREAGARITAYDPIARPVDPVRMADVTIAENLPDAVSGAEVVVLVTRWREFGQLADTLASQKARPLVVDGRRMLKPGDFERYEGIGRSVTAPA